jgi:hypothetical protein
MKISRLSYSTILFACVTFAGASNNIYSADIQNTPPLAPLPGSEWTEANARHLLARAGFGGTPHDVKQLHAMGLNKAVNHLVDLSDSNKFNCPLNIGPKPQSQYPQGVDRDSDKGREIRKEAQRAETRQYKDLQAWWVKRMVESPRPLEEKMTLFWHGLLVSGYSTVKDSYAMFNQNQLYRKHALGNYGKLLHGIVHDPAMLRYLDNNSNVRGRPNENLAREIMELFSMGEGQGYTENDIKEAARALTGNVYDRDANFVFREKSHDPGEKTIFDNTGNFDSDDLVNLILEQPATARYVATKLLKFFALENPDDQTVNALAAKLRDCDYELKPALKTLFKSKTFYSDQALGRQIKSPVQLVVGTARALNLNADSYAPLVALMTSMEQEVLNPPNVKGWDGGHAWMNTTTVFNRYNFAGAVESRLRPKPPKKGENPAPAPRTALSLLDGNKPGTPEAVVNHFINRLFVVLPAPEKRAQLVAFLKEGPPLPSAAQWKSKPATKEGWKQRSLINDKLTTLIVLMMSMPEYQLT